MVKFYDPSNEADLLRVERILSRAGVEYTLGSAPTTGNGPLQLNVAEEDLPTAERLIQEVGRE